MIEPGQVVLFPFPYSNHSLKKVRPALIIRELPGQFDDWLICMISTQMSHFISGLDEIVYEKDEDFIYSGLKTASLIRITRLAVVSSEIMIGNIGSISHERLMKIRKRLSDWIIG